MENKEIEHGAIQNPATGASAEGNATWTLPEAMTGDAGGGG
ncbi:hypothetical protein [Cryobacterium cheniae]|nr:hypothetical protein [Cryobacterium cheniae]